MKKILIAVLVIALAFIATGVEAKAKAASGGDKYVTGGFEASGNIVTGLGYQHYSKNAANSTYATFDGDYRYNAGPMGKYLGKNASPRSNHFNFFVDQVELDIMKSFGENIRMRADLSFGRGASWGSTAAAANTFGTNSFFVLEQAYATANIPLGNGIELLIGRFNTPMGFEAVNVVDNDTISKSVIATGLRPTNTTGAKIYYAFSDLIDLHFYVVNTLTQDTIVRNNSMPGFGARLGFNWGSEGTESTFGLSPFFGPANTVSNKHYTMGVDADLNWWITEAFALGAEAIYRRDDALGPIANSVRENTNYMAGLLNLHYLFSDVWDGTLKYVFSKQFKTTNGQYNLTGQHQSTHQIALAGGYSIADGAKLKLEGRFDIVNPVGPSNTQYVYGAVMAFAYNF